MTNRTRLIAANWKMNGDAELVSTMSAALSKVLKESADVSVLICPPNTLLSSFSMQREFSLGGQNVNQHQQGAFTGETSISQLEAVGCDYVLLGHSERRVLFGEHDALIAEKFLAVATSGLVPLLCIGESLDDREKGDTEKVLKQQLDVVIALTEAEHWQNAVIAYEPVWAIGTGKTATPEIAQSAHKFVRDYLATQSQTASIASAIRILYGGSMKPSNATQLLDQPDVDGGLVGGASLSPDSFVAIVSAAINF